MHDIFLRVVVMGTRGKSSFTEWLAGSLVDKGYKVLSRQTGLIPVARYQNDYYLIRREDEDVVFDRQEEARIILDYFSSREINILVLENNAISQHHTATFNEYIRPQIVFILTLSPDHILDQGVEPEETAEIFLASIPPNAQIIFWTNHKREVKAMRHGAKKYPSKKVEVIYGPLKYRDRDLAAAAAPYLKVILPKSDELPALPRSERLVQPEVRANLGQGKTLVNLGSINDLLHTQLFIDEVIANYTSPHYLLFNFRADREERSWQYMAYFLNNFPPEIRGVIVYSESQIFSTRYLEKYFFDKFNTLPVLPCSSIDELQQSVIPSLPAKSTIMVLANTANNFGKHLIEDYKLFQDSYPILKKTSLL